MFPPRPQQRTRIPLLDTAKVIAISLVILGHLYPHVFGLSYVRSWIYHFHMPLFFLISGYLHRSVGGAAQVVKCWKFLLLPSLVWIGIYLIGDALRIGAGDPLACANAAWSILLKTLHNISAGTTHFPCGVVWFCFALTWCRLLGELSSRRSALPALLLLYPIAFLYMRDLRCLFFGAALAAFPYYAVGMLMRQGSAKFDLISRLGRMPRTTALLAGCSLLTVTLFAPGLGYYSVVGQLFGHTLPLHVNILFCYGMACLGIAGVLLVAQACPFSETVTMRTLSRGTLILMCSHTWLERADVHRFLNAVFPPFHEGVLVPLCCRIGITLLFLLLGLGLCKLLGNSRVGQLLGYRA